MNFFQSFGRWVGDGLRRMLGVQYTGPGRNDIDTGAAVNFDTALQLSAVWACAKLLSETVASLPLTIYRTTSTGRIVASLHPLATLFSGMVNRYQTKVEFFETVLLNLILHGNAYCIIQRVGSRIIGLLPIMSAQVETRLLSDGSVVHVYYQDTGVTVLSSASVWHLKLMGNGIVGLSPLKYQATTIGIAQGAESAAAKIYKSGGKPSGVLNFDRILTPAQRTEARVNFNGLTEGDERLLVLEKGAEFKAISLSPQDIELLSSRKFQISEICRWYGVPSVMVNDNNGTSVWGSGIAQIVEGFYKLTLRPILEKIEASIDSNLLGSDRLSYSSEFDFDALLRADMKSRVEGYRTAIQAAVMTPNEARRRENLEDMEGGNQLFIQGATVPITMAGEFKPPQGGEDGNQTPGA